jgi:hypothetical protein
MKGRSGSARARLALPGPGGAVAVSRDRSRGFVAAGDVVSVECEDLRR